MSNKLIGTALIAVLAVVVLGVAFSAASKNRKNTGESSTGSEIAQVSEQVLVPAVMPEKFSMQVPAGFSETGSKAFDKYYVFRDASIIVTGEKLVIAGEQLDRYADNMKKQYESTADEYTLVKEETVDVNGVLCKMLQFRYAIVAPDAKQVMECLTGVMIKDNETYIITCKSHAETFPGYYETFRSAIKSVVIADTVSTAPQTSLTTAPAVTEQTQTTLNTVVMTAAQP